MPVRLGRQREAIAQRPQKMDFISDREPAQPIRANTDDAVNDFQLYPILSIPPTRQREGPSQDRVGGTEISAEKLWKLVLVPEPIRFYLVICIHRSAGDLHELPGIGRGKRRNPQHQPVMLPAKQSIAEDVGDKLASRGSGDH